LLLCTRWRAIPAKKKKHHWWCYLHLLTSLVSFMCLNLSYCLITFFDYCCIAHNGVPCTPKYNYWWCYLHLLKSSLLLCLIKNYWQLNFNFKLYFMKFVVIFSGSEA
jgi:hypothetical protein